MNITKGIRYLYRAKIGGDRQLINVVAMSTPYLAPYGKGRKAMYVQVFGYGFSGQVLASKLVQYPTENPAQAGQST